MSEYREEMARRREAEDHAEIARLRAVIKQVAETPCDCACLRRMKDGSHWHDCIVNSQSVRTAKEEVAKWRTKS